MCDEVGVRLLLFACTCKYTYSCLYVLVPSRRGCARWALGKIDTVCTHTDLGDSSRDELM